MPATGPFVTFGFDTALHILRAARFARLDLDCEKNSAGALPSLAPRKNDIEKALSTVEELLHGQRIPLPAHVLVRGEQRFRRSSLAVPHMLTTALPKGSFCRIDRTVLCASTPLTFIQMATTLPFIHLVELGYELCGSYCVADDACFYSVQPLATVRSLRSYARANPSLRGAKQALRALAYVADESASPRETKLALILGLPTRYGGYGLGTPRMNHEVAASSDARSIAKRRSFRCDLYWPRGKLDVEYQSREYHSGERERIRDSKRANALATMGYSVITVTNEELDSLAAMDVIAKTSRQKLGRRRETSRFSDEELFTKRAKLRRQLDLPMKG